MAHNDFASVNKKSYLKDAVVKYWSNYSKDLFYGERQIFERQTDVLNASSFLDVGVGGGRTTGPLRPQVKEYLGLDYSQKLVEQCRQSFPGVAFICGNACELVSVLNGRTFDFIYFSFNGIDCLDERQRLTFLQQAYQSLNPGGRLMFSSHNYYAGKKLGRRQRLQGILSEALDSLRQRHIKTAARIILTTIPYLQNCKREYVTDDIMFLIDGAQGNREIYAWVKPERQVEELCATGFRVNAVHDWYGEVFERGRFNQIATHSAYYLAEKS